MTHLTVGDQVERKKDNMKLDVVAIHLFDRAYLLNQGVVSDEMVATSVGVTVRRVIYQDPETGITCVYPKEENGKIAKTRQVS